MPSFLKKMIMNCDEEKVNMTPLTLTAEEAGSTVKLTKSGSPTVEGIQYRIGTSGGWSPYTIDTVLTLANVGDCVQFQNTLETLGTDDNNYASFVITGQIAASGNCMSMLNFSDKVSSYAFNRLFEDCSSLTSAPELPATTLASYCYQYMFHNCTSLTSAPELPATSLVNSCYQYMFYGCTSLVNAPALPATTLAPNCYAYMFRGCTALVTAPELPATTLTGSCYYSMFSGCTSLTSAPELPATSLATYCYGVMFYGCTALVTAPELPATTLAPSCYANMFTRCAKLNSIKVNFSAWLDNSTNDWVLGVSSTGEFNAPSDLPQTYSDSNIPTGWTLTNN